MIAAVVRTGSMTLEPLRPDHADEMAVVLADAELHRFIGGRPATADELRDRYARQAVGRSPDGSEDWLNWVVRVGEDAVGTVQATVTGTRAELAWVIGAGFQRRGHAAAAARAMADWLREQGVRTFVAHIHPDHRASARVAEHLGLVPTATVHDGETLWTTDRAGAGP